MKIGNDFLIPLYYMALELLEGRHGFRVTPKDDLAIGSCQGGEEPTQISTVGEGEWR